MKKNMTFIPMSNDYVFTEIMKHPKVLIGFLSALLKVPAEEITVKSIRIMNRFLPKDSPNDKQGILDVRVEVSGRGTFVIEMQARPFPFWENRSIYYTCKSFVEGGQSGAEYDQFQKTVGISILGFNLISDSDYFYSSYKLREDRRHTVYSELMEIHVIELKKLMNRPPEPEDEALYRWAMQLNAKSWEEAHMIEKDPYIEEALKELERLSLDPERRDEYEYRERSLRDYATMTKYMKTTVFEEGREEGRKEGRKEGREEGHEEGREETQKEVAVNAIKLGLSNEQIHAISGIPEEMIEELRKKSSP